MNLAPTDVVRAAIGTFDVVAASRAASLELGRDARPGERDVFRILGARQVAQAAATSFGLSPVVGVVVDGLHVASMLGLAVAGPDRFRRGALVQTAIGTAFLIAGVVRIRR